MPTVADAQVRKLMEEIAKSGVLGMSATKAGMDRKTGWKYRIAGKLPSEMKKPRSWRTREDPFGSVWDEVVKMLKAAPELEARTIFDFLVMSAEADESRPTFEDGQLRTLQRRVRVWRAQEAPNLKEVFFEQDHRPGEALQTDFTHCTELEVTIGGESFDHMLCHSCLPYSNWQSASVCHSESMLALRGGIQKALFSLGRVPEWSQTDNSTAATHQIGDTGSGKRAFNERYVEFVEHFGMKPRTIGIGKKEQNGDIESANGALKQRIWQYLLLRGSRDFESVNEYGQWLDSVIAKANARRAKKVTLDLAAMRPLVVSRLREFDEDSARVSRGSTIRVQHNTYSVPSRLIGQMLKLRIYEERIEARYAGRLELETERLRGRHGHRIDYRHIIWWLVRKPGALSNYRYREAMFPGLTFRRTYDRLTEGRAGRTADLEYLQILLLAASTMETDVEAALELLLEAGECPDIDLVKALIGAEASECPSIEIGVVDLSEFDALLKEEWA